MMYWSCSAFRFYYVGYFVVFSVLWIHHRVTETQIRVRYIILVSPPDSEM